MCTFIIFLMIHWKLLTMESMNLFSFLVGLAELHLILNNFNILLNSKILNINFILERFNFCILKTSFHSNNFNNSLVRQIRTRRTEYSRQAQTIKKKMYLDLVLNVRLLTVMTNLQQKSEGRPQDIELQPTAPTILKTVSNLMFRQASVSRMA